MEARYGQKRVPCIPDWRQRPPQALKCSVGALRACTPQKGHMLRVTRVVHHREYDLCRVAVSPSDITVMTI
eukprot:6016656-Prymnesium_polylepis.1